MLAIEREAIIEALLRERPIVSFDDIERSIEGSPATLRRDLQRMAMAGRLERVRGGARRAEASSSGEQRRPGVDASLVPPDPRRLAIGRTAAALVRGGEAITIAGGSTTLLMCEHLKDLELSVLTNSLAVAGALASSRSVRVAVTGGALLPGGSGLLSPASETMPRFCAPKLFIGASAARGDHIAHRDWMIASVSRHLIEVAEEVVLLVESAKLGATAPHVICGLGEIDTVVSDAAISEAAASALAAAGVQLVVAR